MLDSASDHPSVAAARTRIAVSIKQPWATLVVHGLKTIELRRWRPKRTGRVYIHTGAKADASHFAWMQLPPELASFAKLRQGLLGRVDLTGVAAYGTLAEFRADRGRHLAPDEWFADGLVGWTLSGAEPIPFEACRGNLRFFRV